MDNTKKILFVTNTLALLSAVAVLFGSNSGNDVLSNYGLGVMGISLFASSFIYPYQKEVVNPISKRGIITIAVVALIFILILFIALKNVLWLAVITSLVTVFVTTFLVGHMNRVIRGKY